MKKFLFLFVILFGCFAANAQFQVSVELQGDCVEPDQNTYYVVKFYVYNIDDELIEPQTVSVQTTYAGNPVIMTAQFSSFCTSDNHNIYKIYAEAAKVYPTTPPTVICSGKKWTSALYSCDDFVFYSPIDIGVIILE